jgi:hypothetical protein
MGRHTSNHRLHSNTVVFNVEVREIICSKCGSSFRSIVGATWPTSQ